MQVNETVSFKFLQRPRDSIIPKEVPSTTSHSDMLGAAPAGSSPPRPPPASWGPGKGLRDAAPDASPAANQKGKASGKQVRALLKHLNAVLLTLLSTK